MAGLVDLLECVAETDGQKVGGRDDRGVRRRMLLARLPEQRTVAKANAEFWAELVRRNGERMPRLD